MNEDMKLAAALIAGASRSIRTFERRFREDLAAALTHCRAAVDLGLEHDEYRDAVAHAAARSLLSSMPADVADARLEPHVLRILGHRDFGLAILLKRGREDAWQVFVERFGSYIRALFVRSGQTSDQAMDLLQEVVAELRGEDGQVGQIAEYQGRSDIQNWLYCYVRGRFQGGFAASLISEVPRGRNESQSQAQVDLGHDQPAEGEGRGDQQPADSEVAALMREVFAEQWHALAARDRKLLEILAAGGSALALAASGILAERHRAPDAAQLLARHRILLDELFDRSFWKLVERFRGRMPAPEVEEALHRTMMTELDRELMPVLGLGGES